MSQQWVQAKQPRKFFYKSMKKETNLFELIHNDVCVNMWW